ncbi:MAG: T9SS type A sorting domain-containing protein [Bacteroidetes bacterium]|nr:T9SS type A sorting domain-containing protein [Bacteroidota bacterium]
MKRYLLLIVFAWLFVNGPQSYAQITFNNTYHDDVDGIFTILVDGSGYKQVMHSMDSPYRSFIFQNLDSNGNVLLSKKYGGAPETYAVYSLIKTADSNFAIGAYKYDFIDNRSYGFIGKLNSIGDTLWTKSYIAPNNNNFIGDYMIETSDHGFLITGQLVDSTFTNGDIAIMKSDSVGNFEWMNSLSGVNSDCGYSSVQTPDGGYLTAGWTRSFGFGNNSNRDVILVKWDSLGNYLWYQTYGSSDYEMAIGITQLSDGNYILSCGSYILPNGPNRGWIIKIDQSGAVLWQKFQYSDVDCYNWVREMSNFDLVGSSSRRVNGIDDGFIIRTDSSGNEKWRRQYRFGNDHCYFRDVQETPDGGIICAGFVFDGASGGQDGWLVKLDSTGCLSSGCGEPTSILETPAASSYTISVSPNPVKEEAVIKIEGLSAKLLEESYLVNVYDLTGKLVASPRTGFLIAADNVQFIFKSESLVSGIYLLEISTTKSERIGVVKLVVQSSE